MTIHTCHYCKKKITEVENKVLFKEFNNRKTFYEYYFHAQCWIDKYTESLDKKIREYSTRMMNTAVPLIDKAFRERGIIA